MLKKIQSKYCNEDKKHCEKINTVLLIIAGILISAVILLIMDEYTKTKKNDNEINEGGYEISRGVYQI